MFDGQLEMSFANGRGCQSITRRQRRLSRAQWWFQRMRQVVDRAIDWPSAPPPRPEQIWFPGVHRQIATTPEGESVSAKMGEHQICE